MHKRTLPRILTIRSAMDFTYGYSSSNFIFILSANKDMRFIHWVYIFIFLLNLLTLRFMVNMNNELQQCQTVECKQGSQGETKIGPQGRSCLFDPQNPEKCNYQKSKDPRLYTMYACLFFLSVITCYLWIR